MFKSLLPVLFVISVLLLIPPAHSSHDVCSPGYIAVIDSETGFTKCVFEPKIQEEIPPQIELEFADFQEHLQIVLNKKNATSELSAILISPNSQDIFIPPRLESTILNTDSLHAVVFSNKWMCAPGLAADPCILVQINREGLGEFKETVQKNTREIADQIVYDSQFIGLNAEFHSIVIEAGKPSQNIPPLATVVYVTNYFPTERLISLVGNQTLDAGIINAGGFYSILNTLTENDYTEFHLTLIPDNDKLVRNVMVTLSTSNLPDEIINVDTVSPLDLITASVPSYTDNEIYRSEYYSEGFFPLNSVINVLVITEPGYQVKSVNGGLIETISSPRDLENAGWFFTSNSNGKIEGKFLFGLDEYVSKNDLVFSITNNKSEYLGIELRTQNVETESTDVENGGCLIATAAFGSEMAPQVQLLREIRDDTVLKTESGSAFMTKFNNFYYLFSPTIADYERENPLFKESVKLLLTPLLTSLTLLQFVDIDSESEMIGYGISIILLNITMYFVIPVVLVLKAVRKIQKINLND